MGSEPLSEVLRETLDTVDGAGEPLATTEVADRLGVDRRTAYGRLERLVEQDRLESKLVGANGRIWWLPTGAAPAEGSISEDHPEQPADDRLRALYESSRRFLTADSASAISDALVDTTSEVLDLPGVVVYGYDADRDRLVPETASADANFMGGDFPPLAPDDSSIAGYVFSRGEPRYYEDVLESPHLQVSPETTEMRAGFFVPLDAKGILIASSREADGIDEQTRQLIELLATNATAAYKRVVGEQELRHQREQLLALNSLNEVIRELTNAVIAQSTRGEIEATVCEHLAASDSYLFAWIGDADGDSQTVRMRTEAGVEGYLEGVGVSVDPDDERSEGPTGRAFRTGEMQASQDVLEDPEYELWRGIAREYGFRSSAAVPIVHEETVYGVLNVYADRPRAFDGQEGELISQVGEIIGHAIAAAERKQALLSDDLVELEFQIQEVFSDFEVPVSLEGTITFEHAVTASDDEFLYFGTVTSGELDTVTDLAEELSHWGSVTVQSTGEPHRFELRLTEPPVLSAVTSVGGYIDSAVISGDTYRLTIHLPASADVRRVTDVIEATHSQVTMLRRHQITRPRDDPLRLHRQLVADLTDRQRAALDTAYYAGFFEWPRESSGEELAESLDISSPTFHQHLRKAQLKVFDEMYSTTSDAEE